VITPSKINVLDVKNSKLLNKEPAKKAEKDKGFGAELIEKQKKLKKRDDEVAASQDSQKQNRADSHPERSEGSNARRSDRVSSRPERSEGSNPALIAQMSELQEGANLEQSLESAQAMMMAEGAEEAAVLAQAAGGKFAIEGMEMVKPQAVSPEMLAQLNSEKTLTDVTSMLAGGTELAAPKAESQLQDLLSQNSGEGAENLGFDIASDVLGANVAQQKETQQANFGTMLKAQEALANQAADAAKQANVDNIITHARTILKDGGGEMQVVLTPEGLGTVDLKVGVVDGQVSVEIMAKDHQVKKLFEDSMFEIRGALESQNLKVDTMKVGISDNFDNAQQFTQGQSEMMEREFARDFMGQFRDERNGFRTQGFVDGLNGSSGAKNSAEGIQPANSQPRAVFNGSGRLNVVV